MYSTVSYSPTPVSIRTSCTNCHKAIELECEGIAGPAGYETYSEYICPRCRKLSRVKTPGHIISARPSELTTK